MAETKEFHTRISLNDNRLTPGERRFLRDVADKLREPTRGGPLPEGHARAIQEAFGGATDGNPKVIIHGAKSDVPCADDLD